jgi:hypothetical protein
MKLKDDQLEQLRLACGGKIGVLDFDDHELVFKRPTRMDIHEYRRKEDTSEKADRLDQLSQVMLAAFDGETDTVRARQLYGLFLDEYPAFTSVAKVNNTLLTLAGMIEEEYYNILGKGVSIRNSPPKTSPPA